MSKILGVDTSTIDNISGLGTGSGGIAAVPATTDTGIVMCLISTPAQYPFSAAELADYGNPAHMFQLSDITGIVSMTSHIYTYGALKSNGEFYVGTNNTNKHQHGLSGTDAADAATNGGMFLALSGVSVAVAHNYGYFAIKTDGTLWFSGSVGSWLTSAALGGGSTTSNNGWAQVGSDTDWHDIHVYTNYPNLAVAIKGAAGSRYLYTTGYGNSYGTGQGNTTRLQAWTRVKSSSGTDLDESISVAKCSYGSGIAVSDSGKLYTWGENAYKMLGDGNNADKPYATQITSDPEDWNDCWITRYGGWAKNTSGEMYMSTNQSSWRIEPNTGGLFTKIGTDTDYEDLAVYWMTTQSMNYMVFAKKGGSWYVSHGGSAAGEWQGSTAASATTQGAWVAINDVLTQNDITGTVDHLHCFYSQNSQSDPAVMFALS
tara:strand:+ start:11792 stop:13081 length:1290 start_codon:yes stop_codon:yes gene_type:complete